MILQRFYDDSLAQASYLVGCPAAGEAIVIDPNRDIDQYLSAAESAGVRIIAVTETHIHADFVSGSRELAARTGAALYLSAEGGPDWQYAYADEAAARATHRVLPIDIIAADRYTVAVAHAACNLPGGRWR